MVVAPVEVPELGALLTRQAGLGATFVHFQTMALSGSVYS
jgi:hypothetical protein